MSEEEKSEQKKSPQELQREKEEAQATYDPALLTVCESYLFRSKEIHDVRYSENLSEDNKVALDQFNTLLTQKFQKMFAPLAQDPNFGPEFLETFEFHVCTQAQPNAFVLKDKLTQDGKRHVCLTKGLIDLCADDDELMAVIGHEVSHIIQGKIKTTANNKVEEMACDLISKDYLVNAGYDPKAMTTILKKLSKPKDPKDEKKEVSIEEIVEDIFDVHPSEILRSSANKIADLSFSSQQDAINKSNEQNTDESDKILDKIKSIAATLPPAGKIIDTRFITDPCSDEELRDCAQELVDAGITLYANSSEEVSPVQVLLDWCNGVKNEKEVSVSSGSHCHRIGYGNIGKQLFAAANKKLAETKSAGGSVWKRLQTKQLLQIMYQLAEDASFDRNSVLGEQANLVSQVMSNYPGDVSDEWNKKNFQESLTVFPAALRHIHELFQTGFDAPEKIPELIRSEDFVKNLAVMKRVLHTKTFKPYVFRYILFPTSQMDNIKPFEKVLKAARTTPQEAPLPLEIKKDTKQKLPAQGDYQRFLATVGCYDFHAFDIYRYTCAEDLFGQTLPLPPMKISPYFKTHNIYEYANNGFCFRQFYSSLTQTWIYDPANFSVKKIGVSAHVPSKEDFYKCFIPYFDQIEQIAFSKENTQIHCRLHDFIFHEMPSLDFSKDNVSKVLRVMKNFCRFNSEAEKNYIDLSNDKDISSPEVNWQVKIGSAQSDPDQLQAAGFDTPKNNWEQTLFYYLRENADSWQGNKDVHALFFEKLLAWAEQAVDFYSHRAAYQNTLSADAFKKREAAALELASSEYFWKPLFILASESDIHKSSIEPWWNEHFADRFMDLCAQEPFVSHAPAELAYTQSRMSFYGSFHRFLFNRESERPSSGIHWIRMRQKHPDFVCRYFGYEPIKTGKELDLSRRFTFLKNENALKATKEGKERTPAQIKSPYYDPDRIYDTSEYTRFFAQRLEVMTALLEGRTDIPAVLLLSTPKDDAYPIPYSEMWETNESFSFDYWNPTQDCLMQYLSEQEQEKIRENFERNLSCRDNWPKDLKKAFKEIINLCGACTDNQKYSKVFDYIKPLVDEYVASVKTMSADELCDSLGYNSGSKMPVEISAKIVKEILKGAAWLNGKANERLNIYTALCQAGLLTYNITEHRQFAQDLCDTMKRHLIEHDKTYKNKPNAYLKEFDERTNIRMLFELLKQNYEFPFPDLRGKIEDMWVTAVRKQIGCDDNTPAYLGKIKPYVEQLDLEKIRYSALTMERKAALAKKLQEAVVSQRRLSHQLDIGISLNGIFEGGHEKIVSQGVEALVKMAEKDPMFAQNVLNYLLEEPSRENTLLFMDTLIGKISNGMDGSLETDEEDVAKKTKEKLNKLNKLYSELRLKQERIKPEMFENAYEQFWNLPFKWRTVVLLQLFTFRYPNQHDAVEQKNKVQDMLDRILPPEPVGEFTDIFRKGLYNFATAVPPDSEIRTEAILAGCLSAQSKADAAKARVAIENETPQEAERRVLAQSVRLFLEGLGPAGIKFGQVLSVHQTLPIEFRRELRKLTNNAEAPTRCETFQVLEEFHKPWLKEIDAKGLGPLLGAASLYSTHTLGSPAVSGNDPKEVIAIAKREGALDVDSINKQIALAIENSLSDFKDNPAVQDVLRILRDSINYVRSMTDVEMDGNLGYKQMLLAQNLYDGFSVNIGGKEIVFEAMAARRVDPHKPLKTEVKRGAKICYDQSLKVMNMADGDNYEKLPDDVRQLVAKANFALNVRTILKGGLFDNDRHAGQLKVFVEPDRIKVSLFDSGCLSLEEPLPDDLEKLGRLLQGLLSGMSDLQFKDQQVAAAGLRRLFPKSANRIDQLLAEKDPMEQLAALVSMSVNELRDHDGSVSNYIAKVELGIANLRHFTQDIPSEEILPLMIELLSQTDSIHQRVVIEMQKNAYRTGHYAEQAAVGQFLTTTGQIRSTQMRPQMVRREVGRAFQSLLEAPKKILTPDDQKTYINTLKQVIKRLKKSKKSPLEAFYAVVDPHGRKSELPVYARVLAGHLMRLTRTLAVASQSKEGRQAAVAQAGQFYEKLAQKNATGFWGRCVAFLKKPVTKMMARVVQWQAANLMDQMQHETTAFSGNRSHGPETQDKQPEKQIKITVDPQKVIDEKKVLALDLPVDHVSIAPTAVKRLRHMHQGGQTDTDEADDTDTPEVGCDGKKKRQQLAMAAFVGAGKGK